MGQSIRRIDVDGHGVPQRSSADRLAVDGGIPVRPAGRRWPTWPVPARNAGLFLETVLRGERWAITSPAGRELFERRFARMFADYVGTRHCVPVDHGSSALVVALEALGLDHGDRVLVPGLTWVATASAVLRAGLVPVLMDVDPLTGCLAPEHLDFRAQPRAVLPVHWSCAMADIPEISAAAAAHGARVVEDAAQAHGAEWLGRPAGSLALIGCFSMQQSKVLAGGEGGAVVTDDDRLVSVMQELRADSRRYTTSEDAPQGLELEESATMMGANLCLSEFGAALLCAQLEALDAQHEIRNRNYAVLAGLIEGIPGVRLLRQHPEQTRISVYELPIVFDPLPTGMSNSEVAEALTAELGVRFYPPREPLSRSRLLRPWTKPTLGPLAERFVAENRGREFPNAEYLASHSVLTHHSTLLGDERDMADIANAVAKVVFRRS
ncbi:DegT/DnrJ/EryC1/StrS family aminotransferase [Streptomyces sp. NPDC002602]|uniref:DegT/DnrJ/EryC1/StrS family aminotransferase n=1 Tax=Streptomyces sp. NPDC002602 TaxID=3364654 RepID=UPI0036C97ADC